MLTPLDDRAVSFRQTSGVPCKRRCTEGLVCDPFPHTLANGCTLCFPAASLFASCGRDRRARISSKTLLAGHLDSDSPPSAWRLDGCSHSSITGAWGPPDCCNSGITCRGERSEQEDCSIGGHLLRTRDGQGRPLPFTRLWSELSIFFMAVCDAGTRLVDILLNSCGIQSRLKYKKNTVKRYYHLLKPRYNIRNQQLVCFV